jgi:hypothetical protein
VDNFVLFKKMMVARNKALNEEALKEMGASIPKEKKDKLAKKAEK